MRKLVIANSILAFLLLSIFTLGYYFILYPQDFDIKRYVRDAEWKPFGLSILLMVAVAGALSFLPIKNYKRNKKAAVSLIILQGLYLSWFVSTMVTAYRQNKLFLDKQITETRKQANADIESGFIERYNVGGLERADEVQLKMKREIDSVGKRYGVLFKSYGCTIDAVSTKAQEEYKRLTKPYLDKRNGQLWEKKMEKEIALIHKKYR